MVEVFCFIINLVLGEQRCCWSDQSTDIIFYYVFC